MIAFGCNGVLSIDGVLLNCPAWDIVDLSDLWLGGDIRGDDRLLPGVGGVIAYPRRFTVTRHSLPMAIDGSVDQLGQENADPWVGLQDHIEYLRANVVDPTGVGDGTRPAVLQMPDGTGRYADVHVLRLIKGDIVEGRLLATLEISIPAGVFV